MGSTSAGFYDEEALAALTQAYREIWKAVVLTDPFRDPEKDEQLRQMIVQTVMDLAADGVFGVDELRDRTLAKILFKSEKPSRQARRRSRAA